MMTDEQRARWDRLATNARKAERNLNFEMKADLIVAVAAEIADLSSHVRTLTELQGDDEAMLARLRSACLDKERHLDGYRKAADEDRAMIRRMAEHVRATLRDHRKSRECIGDVCERCLEGREILREIERKGGGA